MQHKMFDLTIQYNKKGFAASLLFNFGKMGEYHIGATKPEVERALQEHLLIVDKLRLVLGSIPT